MLPPSQQQLGREDEIDRGISGQRNPLTAVPMPTMRFLFFEVCRGRVSLL